MWRRPSARSPCLCRRPPSIRICLAISGCALGSSCADRTARRCDSMASDTLSTDKSAPARVLQARASISGAPSNPLAVLTAELNTSRAWTTRPSCVSRYPMPSSACARSTAGARRASSIFTPRSARLVPVSSFDLSSNVPLRISSRPRTIESWSCNSSRTASANTKRSRARPSWPYARRAEASCSSAPT